MIALSLLAFLVLGQPQVTGGDWPAYGRDPGGSRYSPLIARLAWERTS